MPTRGTPVALSAELMRLAGSETMSMSCSVNIAFFDRGHDGQNFGLISCLNVIDHVICTLENMRTVRVHDFDRMRIPIVDVMNPGRQSRP